MKLKQNIVCLAPIIVVATFLFLLVLHYGVDVPYYDDWSMVPIFEKIDNHTINISDLWQQHNEHRVFFPNIVNTLTAYLTRWDLRVEMSVCFIVSLISILMLYLLVLKKKQSILHGFITCSLFALWFFSPVQSENWIWGNELAWFMCIAAAVVTIYLLNNIDHKKSFNKLYISAIATAIISSYSLAGGLIVWIIGLFMLWAKKVNLKYQAIWTLLGGLATFLYYFHYKTPKSTQPIFTFLHQPINFIKYYSALFGRPVFSTLHASIIIGFLLLTLLLPVLYIAWNHRKDLDYYIPWLSIIFFSLAMGLLTTLGRLGSGVGQSLSDRYCAFTTLYIIGVTGILSVSIKTIKAKSFAIFMSVFLVLTSLILLYFSYSNGIYNLRQRNEQMVYIKTCSHVMHPTNECLTTLSSYSPKQTEKMLIFLKSKHWAGY